MGEFEVVISEVDGEDKLIVAANYLVEQLGSCRNLSNDTRKVLSHLLSKLSRVVAMDDTDEEEDGISEIEQRLNVLAEKIMSRQADESMIWDSGSDEGNEYLDAVNELRVLIERLDSFPSLGKAGAEEMLLRKAHDALQTAMTRLEDEFLNMLVENRLPFEPEHMSFRSEEGSVASSEDLLLGGGISSRRNSGEAVIDLVNPYIIPDLNKIANAMISAGYGRECIQTYTIVRKEAVDEFLYNHEIEKMSIEDVLKMDWSILNLNIKKWVHVMRNFVRIHLVSEKWLGNQVFGDQVQTGLTCFLEAVKSPTMQLLNFGEAVSLVPRQPEKLLRILEMYELMSELLPDIDALFSDDTGSGVGTEYQQVMTGLGSCARSTFLEFKNAIATDVSSNPVPGGGVHLLTNYVMNYLMALTDFGETLDSLLREHDEAANLSTTTPPSPDIGPAIEEEETGQKSPSSGQFLVMTRHFYSITTVLESNLQEKSRLYRDVALQHIFLMNNVHYMTRKVMNSELRNIFGSKWIRAHTWKFRQQAKEYERATWCSVLDLLKGEGGRGLGLGARERFQSFNGAFEEVYKVQTGWVIAGEGLREDLRTSVSQWVIQAYWTFYSRHKNNVSEKYVKYNPDELQSLLLDLFSGSPKSLSTSYRRSSLH
ncbi:PREDICTED: exocyst complex component EXO70B1 [Tarenaya hassleriana]|uniref:exocyst complex component EXO70B1 n=1 Tax=Tarenaya hassleriana TaxID=28532 RepID=UPI00053C8F82|nr:PREDICTED: exocyst complex component EXO70B1 [Tarenaya hassleriana]